MKHQLINGLIATMLLALSFSVAADQVPLEDFFKRPQFAGFQISPDGKTVAALAPIRSRLNVVVFDLESGKMKPITGVKDRDVNGFMWANNNRILFFMDKDGNEATGIYAVNKDGSKPRTLVEPVENELRRGARVIKITTVLDRLRDEDDFILVTNNDRRSSHPDVYKMNVNNGRKKLHMRNPGNIVGWFTGWDGKVVGARYVDGLESGMMRYNAETEEWSEDTRFKFGEPSYSIAGLKADEVHGYVRSTITPDGQARDKAAIYEFNWDTGEFGSLIYEHDEIDCCGVMMNRKKKDLIGIVYSVAETKIVYLDDGWKEMMDGINAALPDTINGISSMSDDESMAIVSASTDKQSTIYYLYYPETRKLEFLASTRPWLKADDMAEMQHITFESRDGMKMHAFLTLPPGSDGKNLPMIVHPHGGPNARDFDRFNPQVQFLASRGYAVLQVNFRGSTGYGRRHLLSANKQWGQKMQDDVTDGLQWAIDQGIADKDRVCIYGASYGGYATMAGLTFTPDLYQCGVNYVGVTDLPLLFKTMPDHWAAGREQMMVQIGNPDTEKEFLEQWSPSNHADKIKVPVFMAYGLRDPRVVIEHAFLMEKAMKKNNVEFELMIKKKEGHGFRKEENLFDFQRRLESFLAENLK